MELVEIETDTIQLDQLLKYSGCSVTGGKAKWMIANGMVAVNGTIVTQRSAKVKPGDTICVREWGEMRVVREGEE